MITVSSILENLVTLYIYMFVYNISLLLIFWTLMQFASSKIKTLFSFSDFKFNFFFLTTITISLFSIAGIPPFIGFFTKISILLCLVNTNFFSFFLFFFILLFFGLYFYLQNLRFLYSSSTSQLSYSHNTNLNVSATFCLLVSVFVFFLIFGIFFFDDIVLYFYWLFI